MGQKIKVKNAIELKCSDADGGGNLVTWAIYTKVS